MEAKASQYSADTLLQNEDYSYNCASIFWAILNELMLIDEHANGLITIKSECQNQPKKQILLLLGTKNENLELIVKNYMYKHKLNEMLLDNSSYICGQFTNLILEKLDKLILSDQRLNILQTFCRYWDFLQKLIIQ